MKNKRNFNRHNHKKQKKTSQNCNFKLVQKRNSRSELTCSQINFTEQDFESDLIESSHIKKFEDSNFLARLPQYQGYELLNCQLTDILPPQDVHSSQPEKATIIFESLASNYNLTKKDARKLFTQHISNAYLFSRWVANYIDIMKIDFTYATQYLLETFSERRQVCWDFEAYKYGQVDIWSGESLQSVWDLELGGPEVIFQDEFKDSQVPHTESIKSCHKCGAKGREKCFSCDGCGWTRCISCQGDGVKMRTFTNNEMDKCFACNASGRISCSKCGGKGSKKCITCKGSGQIKCYIKLRVSWINHVESFIVDSGQIPVEKLERAPGYTIYEEIGVQVLPINHFPNSQLNTASEQMVDKHSKKFANSQKILRQRHRIVQIPIATVLYRFHDDIKIFYIFGSQKIIYAPEYPSSCCFCSII